MNLLTFMKRFYLHDSLIENLSFNSFDNELIMTVNFCNWQQPYFKPHNPQNIIGNFIFKGVMDLSLTPSIIKLNSNEINVVHYLENDDLESLEFVILGNREMDVIQLNFKAESVEWIPIELCYEQESR